MSKYIDLVLVVPGVGIAKDKPFLFQAPPFSHIEAGSDLIVYDDCGKDAPGKALYSITVEDNSDELEFAALATQTDLPLKKVRAIVKHHIDELAYDD